MLKGLMTKIFTFLFLFLAVLSPLNALEITALEKEKDGEITASFCDIFQIKNIALNQSALAAAVTLPKDEEIYENLAILNSDIAGKIISCFAVCELNTTCKNAKYEIESIKKIKDNLISAKVVFDGDISAIFLVSSYIKKNKKLYRVKTPQDFKFLNKKYQNNFRTWLLNEIKNKYEMF